MSELVYLVRKGWMTLVDQEAGLEMEVRFQPVCLPEAAQTPQALPGGYTVESQGSSLYVISEGKPAGEWKSFHEEGALQLHCFYQLEANDSRLHGPCKRFSPTGTVLSSCHYVDGLRQGREELFYPSGRRYALCFYRDGIPVKEHRFFYENGNLKSVVPYSNARIRGVVSLYHPDGQVKRQITHV